MAKNFVQPGDRLDMVAPAGGVTSGAAVVFSNLVGVAVHDAAAGEDFVLVVKGVFDLPKTGASTFAVGDEVFATAAGTMTNTAAGNTRAGLAVQAIGAVTGNVRVRLDG